MAGITLSVLRCPDAVVPEQRQAAGGEISLGRGAECDWPLADPDRVLSKKHCVLEFYAGGWQVRDLSTNGTFVNHAQAPIGRDQVKPLLDGDRLRLGAYEIEVRIAEAATGGAGWAAAPDPFAGAPASQGFAGGGFAGGGFAGGGFAAGGFSGAALPGFGAPAGAGGGSGGGLLPDDFDPFGSPDGEVAAPMPDHAPSTAEAFMVPPSLPAGKALIPDEWDLDLAPEPAPAPLPVASWPPPAEASPPPVFAPPPVPAARPSPSAVPPLPVDPFFEMGDPTPRMAPAAQTPPAQPVTPAARPAEAAGPPPAADTGLVALLTGAGLPANLAVQDPDAALRAAGAVLRAAIAGIRALLIARADVKREFRIEQTMLRAANNNPLKFAATEDQALAALLDPRTPAEAAVRETVDDLTAHQVATLAATQAAARALLERLAPAGLESEDTGGGLLPGAREKRLWEAYKRRHALLAEQFDDDFDSAFGKAFARAYEQATGKRGSGEG